MKKIKIIIISILLYASGPGSVSANQQDSVVVNRIRYIAGDSAITELDIKTRMNHIRASRIPLPPGKNSLEKAAVDELITMAIVDREAAKESIIISDSRIDNEIRFKMEVTGTSDMDRFKKDVEKETGLTFDEWKEYMRFQLKKRQLIQISLSVPPPDDDEIKSFYNKNKTQIGAEIAWREIILRPRDASISEESRISGLAKKIYGEVSRNPAAFGDAARNSSDNVSTAKMAGGYRSHTPIHEIAARDQMLAGMLYNMRPGSVSTVFRDSQGRYVIVKLEDKRPVPIEKVEDNIRNRLFYEKLEKSFDQWIEQRKSEMAVTEYK